MTGGLLDFFILEATEYVDQLALASKASASPPEFLALAQRLAGTPPAPIQTTRARQRRSGATLIPDETARSVTPAAATRSATPASGAVANAGASGATLRYLLAAGIAGLTPLETTRLAPPAVGEDDDVIPIEELLFRGRDVLEQALQLGERFRNANTVPDPAALSELYMLQLAD